MSLRLRLTAIAVVLVAAGLFGAALATHHYLESFMLDRLDTQLQVATEPGPNSFQNLPGGSFGLFVTGSGDERVFSRYSPNSSARAAAARAPEGFSSGSGYRFYVQQSPEGRAPRVIFASPLRDVNATVSALTRDELVIGFVALVLVGGLAYWVIGLGLRPLGRIEETAGEIAAGDLSRRVEDTDPRTEVGRLGIALNAMLAQIEAAFAERRASERRLRRFVADASHELRTPLTSVRGYAELFRRGAAERPADLANAMSRIEAESARMGLLVDDLLLLAQLDQGRPLELEPVDLNGLVAELVDDARAIEPDRPIELLTGDPVEVTGDDSRLRQAVGNLLANARAHTSAQTPVTVSVATAGTDAVITVADEGPGIEPENLGRVFERFYRADPSRARASGGTGLGLSIVSSIAEAHGGRAEASSTPGEGAEFRIVLPLAAAPAGDPVGSPDAALPKP